MTVCPHASPIPGTRAVIRCALGNYGGLPHRAVCRHCPRTPVILRSDDMSVECTDIVGEIVATESVLARMIAAKVKPCEIEATRAYLANLRALLSQEQKWCG